MPKFKNPKKLAAYVKEASDALLAETMITVQRELGSRDISPYDEGRFLSNWFAGESAPNRSTTEAVDSPQTNAQGLDYDTRKTYYLSNNLPYAEVVAIEGRVVSQETTWFKDFRTSRIPKIQAEAAKQIKREYDL